MLTNGVPVIGLSGSTGTELRYTIAVPAGATSLSFKTSGGSGNASLYVKFGSAPTTTSYGCRSLNTGTVESCSFIFPRVGTWYVLVRGASAFAGVTLTATFK